MRSCLICDDHALVRDALAGAIGRRWPDATIILAATFPEAWDKAAAAPDLCLADLTMPGADERGGIAGLRRAAPGMPLLVITGSHDDRLLLDLIGGGVAGFVPKTSGTEIIMAAIDLILAGGRYIPQRVADLAAGTQSEPVRDIQSDTRSTKPIVTPRQAEVLRLVAEGYSNKEVARHLDLSPATIKTHVAQAIAAIGATNRTDAAIRARALGLI
ncbi:response regulator transcription factor [Sphingomonas sp. So64.6b]|uniref:response regulator transcription factor n=1 Tax=Sphingomonas sp. So64.6b TaxID=2997354 RepID=UPI001602BD86|nr:response regulator transcription factor [Sphingomonas sp. So64.6b]QNA85216.1 response regulator transcription factor [Sphingomonas sp. So64.6b]